MTSRKIPGLSITPVPAPDEMKFTGIQQLIAIRKDAGLSIAGLSELSGWEKSGIALQESRNRTRIPLQKVFDIAETCGYELILRRKRRKRR